MSEVWIKKRLNYMLVWMRFMMRSAEEYKDTRWKRDESHLWDVAAAILNLMRLRFQATWTENPLPVTATINRGEQSKLKWFLGPNHRNSFNRTDLLKVFKFNPVHSTI